MKKNRTKVIIIALFVVFSLYFVYPTYTDYKLTKTMKGLTGEDSLKYIDEHQDEIKQARQHRIKLGLDLQGGMRVVLEVNSLKLLEDIAKNKDEPFIALMKEVRDETKLSEEDLTEIVKRKFQTKGIRLARYYGNLRDSDDDILKKLKDESANAVDRAMEIVRNRVDQYGVSEPSIQKQGERRIVVELPGVSKEEEVRDLIGKTALLEFKLLIDPEIASKVYDSIDKVLAGKPLTDSTSDSTKSVTAKKDTSKADTSLTALPEDEIEAQKKAEKEHPFFAIANPFQREGQNWDGQLYTEEDNRAKVMRVLARPEIRKVIPSDMDFVWSAKPLRNLIEGKKYYSLYAVKKQTELTGGVVTAARATIDPSFNTPIVSMEMNSEGSREWARITGANIDKRIAIVMDNACFSAPVVRNKIIGGRSQIEGMENVEEAKNIEIVLKSGALPAPVEIIQQASVGPSLGEDSIRSGVSASVLAFILTILFMIAYYRTGGTMADVALFLNLLIVLGVLAWFQGTLTLPGIAGLILTMAVAVDANVLIYERIREEMQTGKTMAAVLDEGYGKAFSAIFDSNLTTFITGAILYYFGTGPIQGFALTLMMGILVSMFTAITVTRVMFEITYERGISLKFE